MTTLVVVDAHAGWPVEVILEHGEPGNRDTTSETRIVEPHSTAHIHIHSGLRITSIKELDRPAEAESLAGSRAPVTQEQIDQAQGATA